MSILYGLVGSQLLVSALVVAVLGHGEEVKRQAVTSATGTPAQVFQTTPELFAGKAFAPIVLLGC